MKQPETVKKPEGKLAILLPGLGAVSTTLIAGVLLARRGLASPVGSLTQTGTLRLGKRTDNRTPRIRTSRRSPPSTTSSSVRGTCSPTTRSNPR